MANGIKVTNQLALYTERILDYPGGPSVTTGVLKCERGKQKRKSEGRYVRRT